LQEHSQPNIKGDAFKLIFKGAAATGEKRGYSGVVMLVRLHGRAAVPELVSMIKTASLLLFRLLQYPGPEKRQ
jgi:hypothetical protein